MFDADVKRSTDGMDTPQAAKQAAKASRKPGKSPRRGKHSRTSWSPNIDGPDRFGFFKLKDTPLRTMDDRQYEDILTDEGKWAALETRMGADFDHALDMFPYAERAETKVEGSVNWIERSSIAIGNFLKNEVKRRKLSEIELPQRYYAIMRMDIEERFPGGRMAGEPGDGDIRDMLAAFRQLFRENLAHYIYKKRLYQLLAVVAFVAISTLVITLGQFGVPFAAQGLITLAESVAPGLKGGVSTEAASLIAATLVAVILVGLTIWVYRTMIWAFRDRSQITYDAYTNSQSESCKTLDKQAALRSKNLFNLIATMAARVDKDESTLDQDSRSDVWPERAYRWTMVIYWLGRRLENLERYTQLQMWLVRRTHYFFRLVASSTNIFVGYVSGSVIWGVTLLVWLFAKSPDHLMVAYYTFVQPLVAFILRVVQSLSDQAGAHWKLPQLHEGGLIPLLWFRQVRDAITTSHNMTDIVHHAVAWLSTSASTLLFYAPWVFAFQMSWRLLHHVRELSSDNWNTRLGLITDNMDIRNWDRFHSVRMPQRLASQVKADKNNILRRESWVAGKNR